MEFERGGGGCCCRSSGSSGINLGRSQWLITLLSTVIIAIASTFITKVEAQQQYGFTTPSLGLVWSGQINPDGQSASISVSAPAGSGVAWAGLGIGSQSMDGTTVHIVYVTSDAGIQITTRVCSGHSIPLSQQYPYNYATITASSINPDGSWSATFTRPLDATLQSATNFIWAGNTMLGLYSGTDPTTFSPPGDHMDNKGSVSGITLLAPAPAGGSPSSGASSASASASASASTSSSTAAAPTITTKTPSATVAGTMSTVGAGMPSFVGSASIYNGPISSADKISFSGILLLLSLLSLLFI